MTKDIFASLSTARDIARLEITEGDEVLAFIDADAAMLSTMITTLGRLRAAMSNPVTMRLEINPVFGDVTRPGIFHVDRQHKVGKEFFIAARHAGFGWLAFTLDAKNGAALAQSIASQVMQIGPKIIPPKGIIT
jgi:hypothetical protein